MDKVKEINNEKLLEEYNYQELDSLKWKIKDLPEFVISNKEQNKWFNKLTGLQNKILDKAEKDHSIYSREKKVERYINYLNTKFGYQYRYYIKDGKIWDGMADRFPCEGTIEEYYMRNRADIEIYIDKLIRIAPLTKEQLEEIVIQNEKIYFN